ncbi:hypothetical protein F5146DRAFT_1004862 [Armillaria mellea]|nr:hypothetical protein F5146DRAFT_1004862 [Armillaria mellea]
MTDLTEYEENFWFVFNADDKQWDQEGEQPPAPCVGIGGRVIETRLPQTGSREMLWNPDYLLGSQVTDWFLEKSKGFHLVNSGMTEQGSYHKSDKMTGKLFVYYFLPRYSLSVVKTIGMTPSTQA